MNHVRSANLQYATDWLERAAVSVSAACLIHCLAMPFLLAALPALSLVVRIPESFHLWALGFAIPMSGAALMFGARNHRSLVPLIFGAIGLALLALGGLMLAGGRWEIPVTVGGSSVLATAHFLNWRRRHHH